MKKTVLKVIETIAEGELFIPYFEQRCNTNAIGAGVLDNEQVENLLKAGYFDKFEWIKKEEQSRETEQVIEKLVLGKMEFWRIAARTFTHGEFSFTTYLILWEE
jgi:hypothetical protein